MKDAHFSTKLAIKLKNSSISDVLRITLTKLNMLRAYSVCVLFISLALITVFSSACSHRRKPSTMPATVVNGQQENASPTDLIPIPKPPQAEKQSTIIPAPWRVWTRDTFGNADLIEAERFIDANRFDDAIVAYARAEKDIYSAQVQSEAFLRRIGTMLMTGKSEAVLKEVSGRTQSVGTKVEEIDSRISLVVAFAYYHMNDIDQTFAWLSLASKGDQKNDLTTRSPTLLPSTSSSMPARFAQTAAQALVRSIADTEFEAFERRWAADALVGSFISAEKLRRASGGKMENPISKKWFEASTYAVSSPLNTAIPNYQSSAISSSAGAITETELLSMQELINNQAQNSTLLSGEQLVSSMPIDNSAEPLVGVLLPLTGDYAEHAEMVKRGIELAAKQFLLAANSAAPSVSNKSTAGQSSQATFRLEFGDTKGDPNIAATEYARLVAKGARIIIGPMLAEVTERIATESRQLGVPFISFAKRRGIPELSEDTFRLGATAENQTAELAQYAINVLGLKSFSIAYPDTPSGREFAVTFKNEITNRKGVVLHVVDYQNDNEASLQKAALDLVSKGSQAVFIPDMLSMAWNITNRFNTDNKPYSPVLLGPAMWDDAVALRGYSSQLAKAVYVTPFYATSEQPNVVAFRKSFETAYTARPGLLSAQGFDAANLAFNAMTKSTGRTGNVIIPNIDRTKIIQNLKRIVDFRGVTGKLTVTPSKEITRRMSVLRVQDGVGIEVMAGGDTLRYLSNIQEQTQDIITDPQQETTPNNSPQTLQSEVPPVDFNSTID